MDLILFIPLEHIFPACSFVEHFGPGSMLLGNFYTLFNSRNSSISLFISSMPVSGLEHKGSLY